MGKINYDIIDGGVLPEVEITDLKYRNPGEIRPINPIKYFYRNLIDKHYTGTPLEGINKTVGTAVSLAALGTSGGWQTLRLLNKNKGLRTALASGINGAQEADKYADMANLVFNPSISGLIDAGTSFIPSANLLTKSGQVRLGIKNAANALNLLDSTRKYETGGEVDTAGKLKTLSRDWDKTLAGRVINQAENIDSVGYKNGRWYAPDKKGYDKNQFGMGVDRNHTEHFNDFVKRDKNGKEYLTEEDERALRFNKIEQANTSANSRYKYAQKAVNRPKGTISKIKDAAVISAIYNLGATAVANGLFEDRKFMLSLFDGTDEDVINRIHEEYAKKGRNDRIAKERAAFGMK